MTTRRVHGFTAGVTSIALGLAVGACGVIGSEPDSTSTHGLPTPPTPTTAPSHAAVINRQELPPGGTERAAPDQLVWAEEFDGPAGSPVDDSLWILDDTTAHPGSSLTSWTTRPENIALTGDGAVRITARHEDWVDRLGVPAEYTSARMETQDAFRYGRIEARINVSAGHGTLAAFWMLGRYEHRAENWPTAGEIDIVELVDSGDKVHGTVHGATRIDGHWQQGGVLESETDWYDAWHIYSVDWEPDSITFAVDGEPYYTITPADLADDQVWSFTEPQHILVLLAVGGSWAADPTDSSVFPADVLVDYIRVYGAELHPRL